MTHLKKKKKKRNSCWSIQMLNIAPLPTQSISLPDCRTRFSSCASIVRFYLKNKNKDCYVFCFFCFCFCFCFSFLDALHVLPGSKCIGANRITVHVNDTRAPEGLWTWPEEGGCAMPAAVRAMSRPHVMVCPLVSYYTKSGSVGKLTQKKNIVLYDEKCPY